MQQERTDHGWRSILSTVVGAASAVAGMALMAPAVGAARPGACHPAPTDTQGGPYPGAEPSDCTGHAEVVVRVTGDPATAGGFAPSNVAVSKGARVTWVWEDGGHNLSPFHPAIEEQGFRTSRTFDTAGSFPYLCQVHPAQRGVIMVRE